MSDIDAKIREGNFWGKNGAIATTRQLALSALSRPGSNFIDALAMMINIHAKALESSGRRLNKFPDGEDPLPKWHRSSKRALWFYNTLWRVCSFFSYV